MRKRTIKFRGKKVRGGEWVYGDLIHLTVPNGIEGCAIITNDKVEDIFPDNKLSKAVLEYTDEEVAVVFDNTVGQFTGLHDKNGKEIYEGDVITQYLVFPHYRNGEQYECKARRGQVLFDKLLGFVLLSGSRLYHLFGDGLTQEVIGNIHDNHEFLPSKNE